MKNLRKKLSKLCQSIYLSNLIFEISKSYDSYIIKKNFKIGDIQRFFHGGLCFMVNLL